MTELEQSLNQELTRLRTAVSYLEEANQLTANVLAAAAEMKGGNELLRAELRAVQQQLDTYKTDASTPFAANQTVLIAATASGALLLSCYALLRRTRK